MTTSHSEVIPSRPLSKTTAYSRAKRILKNAREFGGHAFVFEISRVSGGPIIRSLPPGDKADMMIADFPASFLGVYFADCPHEWITDDFT